VADLQSPLLCAGIARSGHDPCGSRQSYSSGMRTHTHTGVNKSAACGAGQNEAGTVRAAAGDGLGSHAQLHVTPTAGCDDSRVVLGKVVLGAAHEAMQLT